MKSTLDREHEAKQSDGKDLHNRFSFYRSYLKDKSNGRLVRPADRNTGNGYDPNR